MLRTLSLLGISTLLLAACQSQSHLSPVSHSSALTRQSVARPDVEITFTYSPDKTELTCRIQESPQTATVYTTTRRPLAGPLVVAETSVFQNNQLLKKGPTSPAEAKLVIQGAASNGLADVYKDVKERYRLAGLAR